MSANGRGIYRGAVLFLALSSLTAPVWGAPRPVPENKAETAERSQEKTGDRADPEADRANTIVVLGERRNEASSILRTGVEPMKIPWSIQVIPESILKEVRPEALEDALTLVSNVAFQGDSDGRENPSCFEASRLPPSCGTDSG